MDGKRGLFVLLFLVVTASAQPLPPQGESIGIGTLVAKLDKLDAEVVVLREEVAAAKTAQLGTTRAYAQYTVFAVIAYLLFNQSFSYLFQRFMDYRRWGTMARKQKENEVHVQDELSRQLLLEQAKRAEIERQLATEKERTAEVLKGRDITADMLRAVLDTNVRLTERIAPAEPQAHVEANATAKEDRRGLSIPARIKALIILILLLILAAVTYMKNG